MRFKPVSVLSYLSFGITSIPGFTLLLVIIAAAIPSAAAQTCTDIPAGECQALNALYNQTGGDQWTNNTNWLTTGPASDRYGITVDGGHVTEIDLSFNNLTGTFPTDLVHHFLESLVNLESLDLQRNHLTGPVPPELGNMTSLEWIYLNRNDFTGEIPPELANLPNLLCLNLSDNNLSGSIPPELGSMPSLYYLDLYDNNLTGSVPPELGSLPYLKWLFLHKNELSGSIPPQLANLPNLEMLTLDQNSLSGSIPPELGTMANLKSLRLGDNNLSGEIPAGFNRLTSLEELSLYSNNLSGEIPAGLGSLTELIYLTLDRNNLSGTIPPGLGSLTKLEFLTISYNGLTGSIPPELGNLASLKSLSFDSNNLTGSIPPELGNLPSLSILGLGYNNLSGEIPPELGNLASLQSISLISNMLTGEIPSELGNLTNLNSIWFSDNRLTGSIPPELGNLINLEQVALQSNSLSGELPAFLANSFNYLHLGWNCLYCSDPAVLAAVENAHSNMFMSTQTVAPDNVMVETTASSGTLENRVEVSWDPISFDYKDGGYQVYYQKESSPDWYYYGMTADKKASSMTVSNLEPGVNHTFRVNTVTRANSDNQNDLMSLDSSTASAVSGTLYRAFVPNWKQSQGYFTGVVVSNFGNSDFDVDMASYGQDGALDLLSENPVRNLKVKAGLQMSKVGFEFFKENGPRNRSSWIELAAGNSNRMGSIFLFGVSDTQMLDGAESQSSYAKKLYFTRPLDEGFFEGWQPQIKMCIVNPTDEDVTVSCWMRGINKNYKVFHTIPSMGFISGTADDLIFAGHGVYNGYMEIEVTEGAGVVGFSRIEFPGVRTALGMNAVEASSTKKMYSAQLAHGSNIVTNLRLVNTSNDGHTVTLTAIGDDGTPLADPVQIQIPAFRIYSADLGTLFGLEGEGVVTTGSLVVETSGSGLTGDIIFANGDTMEYAMSLSLQDRLFQEAVFNHISNLPSVFTGFAFYNPGDETATVQIEAFGTDGNTVAQKTLVLGPGERIARTLTDSDIWPGFPTQSGGYIKIQSDQPIAGQQLFGDRALRYMAAVPPTTRVEPMFD